jgi:hypothetical protein
MPPALEPPSPALLPPSLALLPPVSAPDAPELPPRSPPSFALLPELPPLPSPSACEPPEGSPLSPPVIDAPFSVSEPPESPLQAAKQPRAIKHGKEATMGRSSKNLTFEQHSSEARSGKHSAEIHRGLAADFVFDQNTRATRGSPNPRGQGATRGGVYLRRA